MKGDRRLGGKINTLSSAAMKKEITFYRKVYYTTELRKAETSAFQGEKN